MRRASARGNEPLPGDAMAESYESDIWLDNSSIENVGTSHATRQLNKKQSLSNLLTTFLFFFVP